MTPGQIALVTSAFALGAIVAAIVVQIGVTL